MIITCPQCSKKFHLEDARLPKESFKVRCSACTLTWMVAPPSLENEVIVEKEIIQEKIIVEEVPSPGGEKDFPPSLQPTNDFLKKLREDNLSNGDDNSSPGRPPFPPRLDDMAPAANSFAQKLKIDWIVLGIGLLIFLFVFVLDNYYQASFFSNLSRKDTYSIDRHKEEEEDKKLRSNQPEYKARPQRQKDSSSVLGSSTDDTESLYLDRVGEK